MEAYYKYLILLVLLLAVCSAWNPISLLIKQKIDKNKVILIIPADKKQLKKKEFSKEDCKTVDIDDAMIRYINWQHTTLLEDECLKRKLGSHLYRRRH